MFYLGEIKLNVPGLAGLSCSRIQLFSLSRPASLETHFHPRMFVRSFSDTAVCYASKDGTTKDSGNDCGKVNSWRIKLIFSIIFLLVDDINKNFLMPFLFCFFLQKSVSEGKRQSGSGGSGKGGSQLRCPKCGDPCTHVETFVCKYVFQILTNIYNHS